MRFKKSVVEKQIKKREKRGSTQKMISEFHTILKKLEKLKKSSKESTTTVLEIEKLETELAALGGLPAYQLASLKGSQQDKGLSGCGKWLLMSMRKLELLSKNTTLKMLDVGAITGEVYENEKCLDVTSIDLNSQSPLVLQEDFFERPIPTNDDGLFDIIGLSLVLNYVPDSKMRGDMLLRTRSHLRESGLLFIVLPLPCIINSRYLTHDVFVEMLLALGYSRLIHHHSKKLAYYLFRKNSGDTSLKYPFKHFAKKEIVDGKKRNNFSIIIG